MGFAPWKGAGVTPRYLIIPCRKHECEDGDGGTNTSVFVSSKLHLSDYSQGWIDLSGRLAIMNSCNRPINLKGKAMKLREFLTELSALNQPVKLMGPRADMIRLVGLAGAVCPISAVANARHHPEDGYYVSASYQAAGASLGLAPSIVKLIADAADGAESRRTTTIRRSILAALGMPDMESGASA